ncbi:hypothetical protein Sta7437_3484 [Stanieria cyanosphaera PCC 7437]|uniref:Uncharacterized protein n=1 Tax=Stanieria cyanosphaera (strain ATCC 29371 / PCC 7437) TaxID=111780 RepID=K9XWL5_STAC7|nr:hypothetical protein [Stanieria cyanosphaera]AFZ36985.1 hypothetical protein Sta7437_3484 [Stanieria cyanosphaera PCC 7437]
MAKVNKKEETNTITNTKKKMSVEDYIKTQFGKYDEAIKKLADA